ncbi:MAG: flagellar hook-length control protein FliK [Syntrophales bacterium]|nr:flagellar hook-length control protein FliK [Syntrophales bacterium]
MKVAFNASKIAWKSNKNCQTSSSVSRLGYSFRDRLAGRNDTPDFLNEFLKLKENVNLGKSLPGWTDVPEKLEIDLVHDGTKVTKSFISAFRDEKVARGGLNFQKDYDIFAGTCPFLTPIKEENPVLTCGKGVESNEGQVLTPFILGRVLPENRYYKDKGVVSNNSALVGFSLHEQIHNRIGKGETFRLPPKVNDVSPVVEEGRPRIPLAMDRSANKDRTRVDLALVSSFVEDVVADIDLQFVPVQQGNAGENRQSIAKGVTVCNRTDLVEENVFCVNLTTHKIVKSNGEERERSGGLIIRNDGDIIFSRRENVPFPKINTRMDLLKEGILNENERSLTHDEFSIDPAIRFFILDEHVPEYTENPVRNVRGELRPVVKDSLKNGITCERQVTFNAETSGTLKTDYGQGGRSFIENFNDSNSLPHMKRDDQMMGMFATADRTSDIPSQEMERSNTTADNRKGALCDENRSFFGAMENISRNAVLESVSQRASANPGTFSNFVMDQVVEGVFTASREGGRMRISLQPETLGKVEMDLYVSEDRVKLLVVVENEIVKHLIKSGMEDLRSSLQQQGLQIASVDVILHPFSDQQDGSSFNGFGNWSESSAWRREGNTGAQDFLSDDRHFECHELSAEGETNDEKIGQRNISIFA